MIIKKIVDKKSNLFNQIAFLIFLTYLIRDNKLSFKTN